MNAIYENITLLCVKRGISGEKMCRDIGVGKSMMSSLKSGRTSTINADTAKKIADYFDVPVDFILRTELDIPDGIDSSAVEMEKSPISKATGAKNEDTINEESSRTKRELFKLISELSESEAAILLASLNFALGKI